MKRILVVDDSKFMRVMLKNLLIKRGYTVVGEAANGRDAFEQYKALAPDLVTLDITMPEMSGLEALRAIIDYDPLAKAVMVSAMGQRPYVEEAIASGAKGFLVKPFSEKHVVATIERLL